MCANGLDAHAVERQPYLLPCHAGRRILRPSSFHTQDEAGRYHLYLGNACPWCHRVLLAYVLRGFSPETLSITQLGSDPTKARRYGEPSRLSAALRNALNFPRMMERGGKRFYRLLSPILIIV